MQSRVPKVGKWYENTEGVTLEVVAFDNEDGTVEVQFYDGTVEEYDLETWNSMLLLSADAPEDWSGSLDLQDDNYGVDLDRPAGESQFSPLDDYNFDD
ncbi:MAG: hypothetical protein KZQ58_00785 [gamma proteobacterium symbiont of Bathyaustriella thionipta]|nr:hypothetical protein [gamma proteobacterium symbiont of Bathyaustriella thionipta]